MPYKITFYVPPSHLETVKQAMFEAGGGRIGQYDCCAWQTLGQGQFRALEGSQPFLGKQGELERIEEYLVEMVCEDECLKNCIAALKAAHPYETPAYAMVRFEQ